MRCFYIHNYYQQPGGEDVVFSAEIDLLTKYGHSVSKYVLHNSGIQDTLRAALFFKTIWNNKTYKELKKLFEEFKPDIAHFHNTFPLISPSAYYAAKFHNIPVVQTLHNYRLICPNALLFRKGQICNDCVGKKIAWNGIANGCYRNSRLASAVVTCMLSFHQMVKTWQETVDVFVCLTDFARNKYVEAGFPKDKIMVKPNFLYPDPGKTLNTSNFALFVGRLSEEKGIKTLIESWSKLGGKIPLKIAGNGPLANYVSSMTSKIPGIEWLGQIPRDQIYDLMGEAYILIFPSEWYEGLPTTIIESFAKGTPVLASNIGAMLTMIENERTGLHFKAGDPGDLAEKVDWAFNNPIKISQMASEAREEFEEKYTAESNFEMLMQIYELAKAHSKRRA